MRYCNVIYSITERLMNVMCCLLCQWYQALCHSLVKLSLHSPESFHAQASAALVATAAHGTW